MIDYPSPLSLAEKLISLPSYVNIAQDETSVINFLNDFLKINLPTMMVEKQYIKDSQRCNLVLRGKGSPKLLVLGHIDTVQPKEGWQTNPLGPIVKQGRLYGLGSADMKGSLAAFLWALLKVRKNSAIDNLMLLMYVDEEYDFKGMKRFIQDASFSKLNPDITLSLDGSLEAVSGCRGLIELSMIVKGKSGHSSNPKNGSNVITQTVAAYEDLSQELANYCDPVLGATTTNIAYLRGGATQENTGGKISWLREGNVIPDTASLVVEVRPSVNAVNGRSVADSFANFIQKRGLQMQETTIRHSIAPWPAAFDKQSLVLLKSVYRQANIPFKEADPTLKGYVDVQMVAEKIKAPTYIIGTGGNNKHGANENVPLNNLTQAARLYGEILKVVLS